MSKTGSNSKTKTPNVIEIKNFSISFGGKQVIDNLNFNIKKGETFGFLGSNGSGKTTTIRSLLGIYTPTKGQLLIDGKKFDPANSSEIGYLPEERGLYNKESVLDVMVYFGQLKGLSKRYAEKWSKEYLKRVNLEDKINTKVDKLSGGQQQKIQLGVTIMSKPSVLILDEPTKGFDPVNRRLLMSIIEEEKQKGSTIIYISHDMTEVERLCDRILLLKNGQAAAYGTIPEILKKYHEPNMEEVFLKVYNQDNLAEGGENDEK